MIRTLSILALIMLAACSSPAGKKGQQSDAADLSDVKVTVYAWIGGPGSASDQEIRDHFTDLKNKGIVGLLYNGGHNP